MARERRTSRRNWSFPPLDPTEHERASALHRAQHRQGVVTLCWLFVLVFGLPLLQAVVPMPVSLRLAGIPVAWLVPVLVPLPAMVLLAWRQLWRAERLERR